MMIGKNLGNIMYQLLLMFSKIKKEKHIQLMFQNITQVIFLRISNGERLWHYLAVKKTISIIKRNNV